MTSVVGTADSIVGQSGNMPIDMLLRKQEVTCDYVDPYEVENHLRSLMKDFKPDEPFLASDQARGGVDDYGTDRGGYQSTERINLRSGARTLTDPYLPEGSFTDWQFLEKDPRGTALGPDMRKHAEQQYARGGFYNYRDDSDNSVPESGWNPWKAQMQIRNAQNITKNYFKNFKTARDGWTNGGIAPGYGVSNKQKIYDDQIIKDPTHAPNINRMDATNNLSNDTSIGWRRTTDHQFAVAKYGKKNPSKSFTTEDWYKNRAHAGIDHDQYVSWQGTNMAKSTALLMMDLARKKEVSKSIGLDGVDFASSRNDYNKKIKLAPSDMVGMDKRAAKETRVNDAHSTLNGEQAPSSGSKLLIHDDNTIEKTHINPTIAEKMSNINKQMTKNTTDDLRNAIQKSADDKGVYMTEVNKQVAKTYDPAALWNTISMYKKGTSKGVKNYKAAVTKMEDGGKKLTKVLNSDEYKDSHTGAQRRGKLIKLTQNQTVNTSHIDNDYGREVERAHLVGPLGSKYMNKFMDSDTDHNDVNDNDRSHGS